MQSFHNDPAIKAKYLARVRMHRELDQLTQGVGWEDNGTTKGCAVGCTLEAYDHSRYPIELGIPEWLAHLEDRIFESLPREQAMQWPEQFLAAIPVGVDLDPLKHKLAIRRLTALSEMQEKAIGDQWGVVAALKMTIAYHENPSDEAAEAAAWSAARSAEAAAEAAARSAEAESAAWSAARSAEAAAEAAAWSAAAESAAWSAARSARSAEARLEMWEQEATYLIRCLMEVGNEQ